jgi:hypothetical protein
MALVLSWRSLPLPCGTIPTEARNDLVDQRLRFLGIVDRLIDRVEHLRQNHPLGWLEIDQNTVPGFSNIQFRYSLSQTKDCNIFLLIAENTIDEFIDFSLAQKHRLARYTQRDTNEISAADLALQKPDLLRALIAPA